MVVSMVRWVDKVAVVTGASSGIGADIAERLVKEGLKVVGLARRKERLEELASKTSNTKGKFYAVQSDITKEEDIINAIKWVTQNVGPISILINNAGVGTPGSILQGKTENWQSVLDTNLLGLSIATREVVANMKENKIDGHIVNICSVAGHYVLGYPRISMYTASKHAVVALTEAIRLELVNDKSKIKITNVSPGLVKTEMMPEEYSQAPSLTSEDISDGIIYALSTPPHVQIHELMIRPVLESF